MDVQPETVAGSGKLFPSWIHDRFLYHVFLSSPCGVIFLRLYPEFEPMRFTAGHSCTKKVLGKLFKFEKANLVCSKNEKWTTSSIKQEPYAPREISDTAKGRSIQLVGMNMFLVLRTGSDYSFVLHSASFPHFQCAAFERMLVRRQHD